VRDLIGLPLPVPGNAGEEMKGLMKWLVIKNGKICMRAERRLCIGGLGWGWSE
jgi:hypothetical protein